MLNPPPVALPSYRLQAASRNPPSLHSLSVLRGCLAYFQYLPFLMALLHDLQSTSQLYYFHARLGGHVIWYYFLGTLHPP